MNIRTCLGYNEYSHLLRLYLLNLPLSLRTLYKIKNTLKDNTKTAHKGITLQYEEFQWFSTQSKRIYALIV